MKDYLEYVRNSAETIVIQYNKNHNNKKYKVS